LILSLVSIFCLRIPFSRLQNRLQKIKKISSSELILPGWGFQTASLFAVELEIFTTKTQSHGAFILSVSMPYHQQQWSLPAEGAINTKRGDY